MAHFITGDFHKPSHIARCHAPASLPYDSAVKGTVPSTTLIASLQTKKPGQVTRLLKFVVEPRGIEPLTSWLPAMRSPS